MSPLPRRTRGEEDEPAYVQELRSRVKALEEEVQECRALNRRLAELTDIVTELLVPVAQRDQERLADLLAEYREAL